MMFGRDQNLFSNDEKQKMMLFTGLYKKKKKKNTNGIEWMRVETMRGNDTKTQPRAIYKYSLGLQ